MKTALVLGSTGFVGRNVAIALQADGFIVTGINRRKNPELPFRQIAADRNSIPALETAFENRRFDLVVDTCAFSPNDLRGFQSLARRADLWVHISSAAVYKDTPLAGCKEDSETGGAAHWGVYGSDKSAVEQQLRDEQLDTCKLIFLRPPYIYGPHNSSDREQFIWRNVLNGHPILVPQKTAMADFIHIEDLAKMIIALARTTLESPLTVLNVTDQNPLSLHEFVAEVAKVSEQPFRIVPFDNEAEGVAARSFFPFRTENLCLSKNMLQQVLPDFRFAPFAKRIAETYVAYAANADMIPKPLPADYQHWLDKALTKQG